MARFSDLPPELRNHLFEELLGSESKLQRRVPNELAMLTVSKQIHKESSSYLYQNNEIVINALSAATSAATILPPIPDRYLRYLRMLTIQAFTGQPVMPQTRKVATAIAALPSIGARFTEINILLATPLSHLLTSRVDDSVMDHMHPITLALRSILESNVAKVVRIHLDHAWFAPGVARGLKDEFGTFLEFVCNGNHILDMSSIERSLTGRYSSTHLIALGVDEEVRGEMTVSPVTTHSSQPSSLCSAFADLDTFSVTSFELNSTENGLQCKDLDDSLQENADSVERSFFTEDDIEEWSAATEGHEQEEEMLGELDDYVEDDEMEDVQHDVISAIMQNMQEAAHHIANEHDITYMANFAPDLLLSRHHLGHLV
jgi:hypothetical protein